MPFRLIFQNFVLVVTCLDKSLERFLIERRKTKTTKVIKLANHSKRKQHKEPMKTRMQIHVTGAKRGKTRVTNSSRDWYSGGASCF